MTEKKTVEVQKFRLRFEITIEPDGIASSFGNYTCRLPERSSQWEIIASLELLDPELAGLYREVRGLTALLDQMLWDGEGKRSNSRRDHLAGGVAYWNYTNSDVTKVCSMYGEAFLNAARRCRQLLTEAWKILSARYGIDYTLSRESWLNYID
ncbi:hypothetical protein HY523_02050 [Candidatus Berkelbacteria bacterium]|nr:hypothetical protein [Candidatus Berkelbacteria bacterium]